MSAGQSEEEEEEEGHVETSASARHTPAPGIKGWGEVDWREAEKRPALMLFFLISF